MIYLDNAATTLIKPETVINAVCDAMKNAANAGRGGHSASMYAAEIMLNCREEAAKLFGADNAENIVFTLNATHALNIAIKGIMEKGGHCVISGYEHNSVVRPLSALAERGVTYSVARAPLFEPESMLDAIRYAIQRDTRAIIVTHVSNVFGYILPIYEIDRMCAQKGIPLIIDASQSAGCIDVKLNNLTATRFICAPGHKGLYGPQGTGILVCRDGREISPIMQGGTGSLSQQEMAPDFLPDRHEAGTQNVHGIAGLSKGIEFVCKDKMLYKREQELLRYLISELNKIPEITLYHDFGEGCQSGVLSFNLQGFGAEEMAYELSRFDIAVRGGLHCSPLAHETAKTLRGTVRVSLSAFNTDTDIDILLSRIIQLKNKNFVN